MPISSNLPMAREITRQDYETLSSLMDLDSDSHVDEMEFASGIGQAASDTWGEAAAHADDGAFLNICTYRNFQSWEKLFTESHASALRLDDSGVPLRSQDWTDGISPATTYRNARPSHFVPARQGISAIRFQELFPDTPLKQANVGDCYLVAFLHSFRLNPRFMDVVSRNISEEIQADGRLAWTVYVPFDSPDALPVVVYPNDMSGAPNPRYGQIKDPSKQVCPQNPAGYDWRTYLNSLGGDLGMRILEAAYAKYKNALSAYVEDVPELGNGFSNWQIREGRLEYVTAMLRLKDRLDDPGVNLLEIEIDSSVTAAKLLLSDKVETQSYGTYPGEQSPKYNAWLKFYLETVDLKTVMITAVTHSSKKAGGAQFKVGSVQYHADHFYSVESIDTENDIVCIVNPWDTGQKLRLTYDEFLEAFFQIQTATFTE